MEERQASKQSYNNSYAAHINEERIQSCEEHCINTARYAESRLMPIGLQKSAYLAGLLHDCGKYSEEFNQYIHKVSAGESVKKGSVIHTFAGLYYLLKTYHKNEDRGTYNSVTAELLAYAVGAHHGLFDCINPDRKNGFVHRLTKQPEYEQKAIALFNKYCCDSEGVDDCFLKASREIETISGKIATITKSNKETYFYYGLLARLLLSAVIDGDRRDTAEFMTNKDFGICSRADREMWEECLNNLEDLLISFPVETEIQCTRKKISDLCAEFALKEPGIYRLNVPTGGGKTLSALRYALVHAGCYNKKRIIYTAPLISIIDQNAEVIRKAIGNDEVILEHHSNIVRTEKNDESLSRYDLLTEAWDSPIIITTLVQLLNTLFSGRTSCIRRFQSLCESIIIIDEVQTIPLKLMSMFNLAVNFLEKICGTTIILCSATQPNFEKVEKHKMLISDMEIIPANEYVSLNKVFKRTELIDKGNLPIGEIAGLAEELLSNNDSLLVVCNTKREAVRIYSDLKSTIDNCYHLSASMCMAHRKEVLDEVYNKLASGEKTVMISTQVIEAGVDISFGAVIRLTAGIDSIIQAAGRCNRNGETGIIAPVYIVRCEDEHLGTLSDIIRSQNATNNLLSSYSTNPKLFNDDLTSSEAIDFYYKSLYNTSENNLFDYPIGHTSLLNILSDNLQYSDEGEDAYKYILRQAFRTAGEQFELFDHNNDAVIVPYKEGKRLIAEMQTERAKYDLAYMRNLLNQAKEYSVSIYSNQIKKLITSGGLVPIADETILVLQEDWYDNKTGLNLSPVEKEDNECNILIL